MSLSSLCISNHRYLIKKTKRKNEGNMLASGCLGRLIYGTGFSTPKRQSCQEAGQLFLI